MDDVDFAVGKDYSLRPTPTRLTVWPGNAKKSSPSGINFKDPYGPTPVEYLTEEDLRYLIRSGGLRLEDAGKVKLRPQHNSKKIIETLPDGTTVEYESAADYARQKKHNASYIGRIARFGLVIQKTGIRLQYKEDIDAERN